MYTYMYVLHDYVISQDRGFGDFGKFMALDDSVDASTIHSYLAFDPRLST